MSKISVLIPDGENEHVLWVTRSLAQSERVSITILSDERWMPVRFSRHCKHYMFRRTGTDYEKRVKALADIAHQRPIDVILPVSEDGVQFAATERQALGRLAALPPIPDLESLCIGRNKWLLNQFACQHGVAVPSSVLVTLSSTFDRRLADLEFPVLLKPTARTDGQGIRRFETASELRRFLNEQKPEALIGSYLVQSYVPGSDVGLSVLCQEGELLAYTIQRGIMSAANRFGPLMAMEFIHDEEVLEAGRTLVAALRWGGVAHIDFRYDSRDGRPKIIEMNARYWGSLLGSLVAGVNFPYLACLAARGIPFDRPEYRHDRYAYATTVIKEALLWPLRKNTLQDLSFRESGLRFFVGDPLPEMTKRLFNLAGS